MIPSRNFASLKFLPFYQAFYKNFCHLILPLVEGVWKPITATRVMIVEGITKLNTESSRIVQINSLKVTVIKTLSFHDEINYDHLPEKWRFDIIIQKPIRRYRRLTLKYAIL